MGFKANIPQPTDNLSDSQSDLLGNMSQLDTSFGQDHYAFSNATANNGHHNNIQTPEIVGAAHPTTTATINSLYSMIDPQVGSTKPVNLIQYSRGWDYVNSISAAPTPITCLQSPTSGVIINTSATTNVLDVTGLTMLFATLYVNSGLARSGIFLITYDGTTPDVRTITSATSIQALFTGNILQILNGAGPLTFYWTLDMVRLNK